MCQNVSYEFLSAASKNQSQTEQGHSEDCVQGGRAENKGLRNIGQSMSKILNTKKPIFGSQQ